MPGCQRDGRGEDKLSRGLLVISSWHLVLMTMFPNRQMIFSSEKSCSPVSPSLFCLVLDINVSLFNNISIKFDFKSPFGGKYTLTSEVYRLISSSFLSVLNLLTTTEAAGHKQLKHKLALVNYEVEMSHKYTSLSALHPSWQFELQPQSPQRRWRGGQDIAEQCTDPPRVALNNLKVKHHFGLLELTTLEWRMTQLDGVL